MSNESKADRFSKLCFSGKDVEIQQMIESGFNPDEVGLNGWTPLMLAIEGDQPKTVELLLKSGANLNIKTELGGFTALHHAVDCAIDGMIQTNKDLPSPESIECIRILLKYGADLNIKDDTGKMPLELYPEAKEILIEFIPA